MTPSRGNPAGLLSVVNSVAALASQRHRITHMIAIDEDDESTASALARFPAVGADVSVVRGARSRSIGEVVNRMMAATPADVYVGVTDRTLLLTPRWDMILAQAVQQVPHGVFWLTHPDLPKSCIFPVITRRWLDAAGEVYTNYFPFWFDDTWIAEVWLFATGTAPLMLPIQAYRQPHKTASLRDLDFWYRFFFALRPMRTEAGRRIAAKLGLPAVDPARISQLLESGDAQLLPRVPQIEAEYGSPGRPAEPDRRYLEAKARAEAILASLPKPTG